MFRNPDPAQRPDHSGCRLLFLLTQGLQHQLHDVRLLPEKFLQLLGKIPKKALGTPLHLPKSILFPPEKALPLPLGLLQMGHYPLHTGSRLPDGTLHLAACQSLFQVVEKTFKMTLSQQLFLVAHEGLQGQGGRNAAEPNLVQNPVSLPQHLF